MQREQHMQRPRDASGKEIQKNFFFFNVPLPELRVCSLAGQEWEVGEQVTQALGHGEEGMQGKEALCDQTPVNTARPEMNSIWVISLFSSHLFSTYLKAQQAP